MTSVDKKEESWDCGGTSHVLPLERAKATFDVELLTNFMDGGAKHTARRRWIQNSNKDSKNLDGMHQMERTDLTANSIKHFLDIHMDHIKNGFTPKRQDVAYMSAATLSSSPLMPHYSLFISTISGQASAEQASIWLPKAYQLEILGAYAQTELGHGSNVRGLQTVAEYDAATQEFVLNTPNLQSMKWWNSNAGCFATHCTMYAQLVTKGESKGVHVFMVQLRDEQHRLLPGVECGDVGQKMGDNAIDTGYIRLMNVRIPREHLLSKRQHVEPDGTYIKHNSTKSASSGKMHYLTMMGARVGMVRGAADALGRAATIAIRFSAVRHQGYQPNGTSEYQIIDYKYQQYRLFSALAYAYGGKIVGNWLINYMAEFAAKVDDASDEIVELHASAAGLKGLCSKQAHDAMEDLRKCCGGHGFLQSSGVAPIAVDYSWKVTAEGDWVVMLLQTARFLVKSVRAARSGEQLQGLCKIYTVLNDPLFNVDQYSKQSAVESVDQFGSIVTLLKLFETRALVVAVEAEESLAGGAVGSGDAWNNNAVQLVEAAICHCEFFMLDKFAKGINECQDTACREVLENLCILFALSKINQGIQWEGIMDRRQRGFLTSSINNVLHTIRPNAVALVDAWDFPDHVLNSTLGSYDGNVYERLYEDAKKSVMNQESSISKGYEFLKEYFNKDFLKLRNAVIPELARL